MKRALVGNVQFVAGRASALCAVLELLQKEGIETVGNPDVYVRHVSNFGIDEARLLSEKAAMRPIVGSRRYFVIVVGAMTAEAQNALLKTLEEERGGAVFFFVHPAPHTLLATVRSRAQMLDLGEGEEHGLVDAKKFLEAQPTERLDLLKPLLEKGDDERRDVGAILAFLSDLEIELASVIGGEKRAGLSQGMRETGLRALYRARRYIGDRGALVKSLLEQVALLA